MNWQNELTAVLQIAYPIIQAPMLGVTTPEMVADISNSGALGSLPVGGLSPAKTLELIQKTKALTDKPFAVNLFAHNIPTIIESVTLEMQAYLKKLGSKDNISFETQTLESLQFHSYHNQISILLSENIRIVSFTFGILDDVSIQVLKNNGTILIGTATCLEEALLLEEKGIDLVVAQGIEAGGHRGTFLNKEVLPLIGTMSLVPQLATKLHQPVIAAGAISDGKTAKAAFILGASAVQVGTAFIASDESAAIPAYKKALQNAIDTDIVLTKAITGRWARGISNTLIKEIEKSGIDIPAYPIQNSLTAPLRTVCQRNGNAEFISLWAGQSANKAQAKPVAEILKTIIEEAEGE